MINGDYELVVALSEFPGKKYREKYCYEHHSVYWQNTGIVPKEGELIHHKDEYKRNNEFENLELITVAEHNRLHSPGKTMIELVCNYCGNVFQREARQATGLKYGQGNFYCDKQCFIEYQRS